MYGILKYVMYAGVLAALVPWITDVNKLSFAQGLPVTPHQLFSYGGLALIVIGYVGRRLSAPRQNYDG